MPPAPPSDQRDPTPQVRALPARRVPIRWLNLREQVVLSMWFVPGLFVLGAFGLSFLILWADRNTAVRENWLPASSPGAAESLSATIAAGMLTFTGVVFSTTLVAIQLAGGQYSPRVVRVFVRSTLTHVTLGIFLATFVFALNTLVETRDGSGARVPTFTILALYVMVVATLAAFITFCHGIVRLLRVQYLLRTVALHAQEAIERFVPTADAYSEAPAPTPADAPLLIRNGRADGVLMSIDMRGLTEVGSRAGGWIELLVQPGEYLGIGTPVARVHAPAAPPSADPGVIACFLLGGERTLIQDPGFGLRQLVNIGCRALSPAINDPTTAVQALDRITSLMATLAERPDPSGYFLGEDGVVRVQAPEPGFARLATLAYTEIALYGAGSPQVCRRLLAAYNVLEGLTEGPRQEVIRELRRRTLVTFEDAIPAPFHGVSAEPDRLGFG